MAISVKIEPMCYYLDIYWSYLETKIWVAVYKA